MLNLFRACCAVRLFCFNLRKKINLKNFNQAQIAGWAEVARDLAQVLFAALVIEGFNQNKIHLWKIFLGVISAAFFWLMSHNLNAKIKT